MSIFLYPATDQTASQHPCRFSKAAAALVAGPLFITTPARALDCNVIPDCASLGYSTEDVDDCKAYLYCPFDESYKKCVSKDYCADYTLESCPDNAVCSSCLSGTTTKYKFEECEDGYNEVSLGNSTRCLKLYDCCKRGYSYNCDGVCSNSSTTSDGTLCIKCLSSDLDEEDSVIDDGIGDPVGNL